MHFPWKERMHILAQQYNLIFILFPALFVAVFLLAMVTAVYPCQYWLKVRRLYHEKHPDQRKCSHLVMECLFGCGEYIAPELMKQHCLQQCSNVKIILSAQHDDKPVVTCTAVQETAETFEWL